MSGFNQALLLGRLAAPPEQLQTKNRNLFIKATIAVTTHRKNSEGVSEEHTSVEPVTAFGKTAEIFLKHVGKGDLVHLIGRLDSNEWESEKGDKRRWLSFIVEQLNLLPSGAKAKPPISNKGAAFRDSGRAAPTKSFAQKPATLELDEHGIRRGYPSDRFA